LLVEDNGTDVYVIRLVLRECGLDRDVRVASDGQEAIAYLRNLAEDASSPCPTLVLLDLNMPKIGGIEVLRHLRSGTRGRRTPVVIVTSSLSEKDRRAVEILGVQAYFHKPNDLTAYMQLTQVIKRILGRP
jgi:CheY-like chemotaxis protein